MSRWFFDCDLGRSLFGVVGLLRGDRLWGESMDILGDRVLIEIRGDLSFKIRIVSDKRSHNSSK